MVKLTYYNLGDAMIPEMSKEYKEKICRENHTYRICWRLYHELADIFSQETPIAEEFGAYLALLEQQRREQYRRYYEWGRTLADGTHLVTGTGNETGEDKQKLSQSMESYSEEMLVLWKLFCCAEGYCRIQEAAYMCVLGMEEEESKKNGIHPL